MFSNHARWWEYLWLWFSSLHISVFQNMITLVQICESTRNQASGRTLVGQGEKLFVSLPKRPLAPINGFPILLSSGAALKLNATLYLSPGHCPCTSGIQKVIFHLYPCKEGVAILSVKKRENIQVIPPTA